MLYFAYGSNLYSPRMRARVPSARGVTAARLAGFRLAFRKRSRDGSTKCDLQPAVNETVWGVVYRIDPAERTALDTAEGEGYERVALTVMRADGETGLDVFTYRARRAWLEDGRPYEWYRELVVAGACEHDLPPPYVAALANMDADIDHDTERAQAQRPDGARLG